jgi:hypothetical protein
MQILQRYILLSLTAISLNALGQNEPIIVDEPQAEFTGRWQSINEAAGFGTGPTFHYAMNIEEKEATAVAIFRPKIPITGKYHVEIASSPGRNRSPKVPCVIHCADGEISVIMDQTEKPGGWHRVAESLQFNSGTSGFVEIRNNGGKLASNDKIVIADAVRFVPTGESTSGFQLLTTVGNGGRIISKPNKKTFEANSEVTLIAEANDGFIFDGWSGDVSGMANPLRVTMENNMHVTAHFTEGNPGAILTAADATFEGIWQTNAAKWGARTNYQFASTVSHGASSATALYQPELSKAGLYDIFIWYSKGTNRADNAPWEIVGKNKTVTVKVNQQVNGGDWVPIANGIEFDSGKKGYVKLSNMTGSANSVVVADSVAFVYVGQP